MLRFDGLVWEDAYSIIEPQINAGGVHVWDFHSEFPIDVRFLKFGSKREIRLNRHDYFELLYLRSGEVTYEVQGQHLRLREGDLFLVGSTLLHRMSSYGTAPVRGAVLYFLPDLIRGTDPNGEDLAYLMPFLVQDTGFPHVVPANTGIPAEVFGFMKRIARELPPQDSTARLSVKTHLKMMLILLIKHYAAYRGSQEVFRRKQMDMDRLRPLFDFLDTQYESVISVQRASALVHMSKSNFMRFFKKTTGQPFVTYLHHFRIAKAERLLSTTDMSIAEISQVVGFCDQSYFGLIFRHVMGISPREYRIRVREGNLPAVGSPTVECSTASESNGPRDAGRPIAHSGYAYLNTRSNTSARVMPMTRGA